MKTAVIGIGRVGGTTAYTLLDRKLTNEILLVDIRKDFLDGTRLDLQSAFPFAKIRVKGSIEDCDVIVMTAGFPRTPDMKSRNELFEKNKKVVEDVFAGKKFKKTAKIVVVTNHSDEIAAYVQQITKLPSSNVIAFGNQLDSNRLKFISQKKDAIVTGGHNENMKMSAGLEKYETEIKEFAPRIIKACGGTVFGPAKAIADIVESISKA
jgi:malate/lactate dehydrogenase